jgi:hypothetical protein
MHLISRGLKELRCHLTTSLMKRLDELKRLPRQQPMQLRRLRLSSPAYSMQYGEKNEERLLAWLERDPRPAPELTSVELRGIFLP